MRVHVGGDHAAFELQQALVSWLTEHGHEVTDHGPREYAELDDYPVYVLRAAEAVAADEGSLGIVLGGSGNGEAMAANKVRGIRAALCYDTQLARLAREHNDATVVSVGGRMHPLQDTVRFVEVFLAEPFSRDERHVRRIGQLTGYEDDGVLPPLPDSARPG